MLRKVLIGAGIVLVAIIAYGAYGVLTTRSHSPFEEVKASTGDLDVAVSYCRPFKKGRLIFGSVDEGALVPDGVYWRLGANDATEISFSKDVMFGGKPVPAGSYRMYAVPDANSWQITLNSELGEFGYFEPNYELDVVTVEAPKLASSSMAEQLTTTLSPSGSGLNVEFSWDDVRVVVPVEAQ